MLSALLVLILLSAACSGAPTFPKKLTWRRNIGSREKPMYAAESADVFEDHVMMKSADPVLHEQHIHRSESFHDFTTRVLAIKHLDSHYEGVEGGICFLTTVAKNYEETVADLEERNQGVVNSESAAHSYILPSVPARVETRSGSKMVDTFCSGYAMIRVKYLAPGDSGPDYPRLDSPVRTQCIYYNLDFILDKSTKTKLNPRF